jgi:hypothetical protein
MPVKCHLLKIEINWKITKPAPTYIQVHLKQFPSIAPVRSVQNFKNHLRIKNQEHSYVIKHIWVPGWTRPLVLLLCVTCLHLVIKKPS